jgi:hypothetical protein
LTEEPFAERVVDSDVRTALFDAEIVRQARDVAWLGRSTSQADADVVANVSAVLLGGLWGPADLVEDTVSAVGQALRATWQLYDHVKAGDHRRAFVDFTEAYTASLSIAGWHSVASRVAPRRLSLYPRGDAARSNGAAVPLVDTRLQLDVRYAVRDIDLGGTRPDAFGVHRLHGRRYIRQHERVFEVRQDSASGTWRLARPNAPDAVFSGPALEPTIDGIWRVRTNIGLRGGWVDDAAFPQPRTRGISGHELEGLSDFQRWTFQQSLGSRLYNGGEASRLYWQATSQAQPRFVTLRQRTAWNDALRLARATPAEPLAIGSRPGPAASWRVLAPAEWPTQLWHYPQSTGLVADNASSLVLPLQALPGSGLVGLPVSTRAPSAVPGQGWIRLNLDRYRGRQGTVASPGLRIIEDRRGPEATYVVQPEVGFPLGFLGLEPGDFATGGWGAP